MKPENKKINSMLKATVKGILVMLITFTIFSCSKEEALITLVEPVIAEKPTHIPPCSKIEETKIKFEDLYKQKKVLPKSEIICEGCTKY